LFLPDDTGALCAQALADLVDKLAMRFLHGTDLLGLDLTFSTGRLYGSFALGQNLQVSDQGIALSDQGFCPLCDGSGASVNL
jgi:hypothetical protein